MVDFTFNSKSAWSTGRSAMLLFKIIYELIDMIFPIPPPSLSNPPRPTHTNTHQKQQKNTIMRCLL